ncbi:nucleolar protein 12 [Metarhizium robertsii]|uniref:Nucleolar protein 12 n=2 Tax=Metarhizium robertsii TaxID=568076 RepID=E9F3R2_METRA|nr:Nucleolar protein 12 [Metarhizium robertsii ARSEF 23]EFY97598.1 Nucleolar protein 12 [Metarhizium robertsii ARSEF 23]EXV05081.1 nucleolar protein 12 [Metarhizium robertsii]
MFARPRPKKSILPPPSKKRKTTSTIEEISFDDDARTEYLTGFHKRKQQRIKHAQEEAAKRARQEKLETRKQIREDRRREVAEHVEAVNRILRESGAVSSQIDEGEESGEDVDEWDGFPDKPDLDLIDHEEEYIDEDRYTTVKVESVSVSRDGLSRPDEIDDEAEEEARRKREEAEKKEAEAKDKKKPSWQKKKKKKFRYESKIERQLTDRKQKAKSKSRRE